MSVKPDKDTKEDVLSRASYEMAKIIESFLRDKKQFKRYHKNSKKEGVEVIEEHISKKADTKAMRDIVAIMKELIQIDKLLAETKSIGDTTKNAERRSGVVVLAQPCAVPTDEIKEKA